MKVIKFLLWAVLFCSVSSCLNNSSESQSPPSITLSNGLLTAKIYLPDAQTGYYRSTRFDCSGLIYSLEYDNHSYIGQWFETYDPYVHESVTGPMQEFGVLGYDSAKTGEGFLKIGVGILMKSDTSRYHFSKFYEIIDPGKWKISSDEKQIEFTHTLESETGYSYEYSKTVQVAPDKPEIIMKHRLKNTGKKPINTDVYNHNFFIIDEELAGPNISVKFNFYPVATGRALGELFDIQDRGIVYLKDLPVVDGVRTTGSAALTGYSDTAEDYRIVIENTKTKAGIFITGDRPIIKLRFWTSTTTYCPEPFIKIDVEPDQEITWEYRYSLLLPDELN